eukprot:TRINITY_DN8659_c0_g1_i1.p1 TRINITY_DN8659_c0_g1~~TRINITY_DN8659_c0_g1_i1.p1  ORF type:complete len:613 (+),score=170.22 TRINITY_DN8659_c0_g1_i1:1-1839(+)
MENVTQNSNILHPKSKEIIMKEILVFVLCTIVLLKVPLEIAFNNFDSSFFNILFIVFDIFFMVDISLNFRIGYINKGRYESDPTNIKNKYFNGGFKIDLLTSLPLEYLSPFLFLPPTFFKLIRLLKVFRLLRQFHFMQDIEIFDRNLIWFFQLFFNFFLLTHCIGCFWLGMGYHYGLESTDWVPTKDFAEISFLTQYLRAFFWAFTAMTSNGLSPKTEVEVILSLLIVFFGLTFYATLIGSVGSFIISSDLSTQLFREKMEKIDEFSKYRNIPKALQKRIKNYYEYLFSRQFATNEQEIIEDLPISLKQDVCLYMNKEIVEKVEFFKNCNNNLISSIVTHLKPIVSVPGEYIIKAGDIGKEMFFISSGACEVVIETKEGPKTVAILKEGSFFGESALLFQEKRNASIRALTYVDLYILTKDVLDEIQNEFKDFKELMENTALKRKRETKISMQNNGTKKTVEEEKEKIMEDLKNNDPNQFNNSENKNSNSQQSDNMTSAKNLVSSSINSGISSINSIVSTVNFLASSMRKKSIDPSESQKEKERGEENEKGKDVNQKSLPNLQKSISLNTMPQNPPKLNINTVILKSLISNNQTKKVPIDKKQKENEKEKDD